VQIQEILLVAGAIIAVIESVTLLVEKAIELLKAASGEEV